MNVLVTNDDGIHAPGLAALREAARSFGDVSVVAPLHEQSGVGHGITLTHPLRISPVHHNGDFLGNAVTGTPADCVKLALSSSEVPRPDVIFSGVNFGHNLGIHVLYSGTVAAAVEGSMYGIPAVALSVSFSEDPDFATAAAVGCDAIRPLVERMTRGDGPRVLNVNVPALPRDRIRGVRAASQSCRAYTGEMERRTDPRGGEYYWLSGGRMPEGVEEGSDLDIQSQGYVTVTPLHFDVTDREWLGRIEPTDFGDIGPDRAEG